MKGDEVRIKNCDGILTRKISARRRQKDFIDRAQKKEEEGTIGQPTEGVRRSLGEST